MKTAIIVAMDKELEQLKSILDNTVTLRRGRNDFVVGNAAGKEVVLMKCGIGKVNAAIGAVELINNFRPDLVISSGCAGGADPSLEVLDVAVASECAYHDAYCGEEVSFGQIIGMPARFEAPAELVRKALGLNKITWPGKTNIRSGLTVSGEWFVDSREKMQSIMERFPDALAVDMESCAIAQVCHVYGVLFISFRVISDVPLRDNRASQYFDFWNRIADGSFEVTKHFLSII